MSPPNREFTAEDLAQHAEWLRRLARALTRVDAEAEDIAQATWERVLDTLGTLALPCLLASLTTAIGFLSLCSSRIEPIREVGFYSAPHR